MYERGLNQKNVSQLLGISTSRVSEYLTDKTEPTLKIAREISQNWRLIQQLYWGCK
jgi:HTH-type transcriptional regulator/antitoxin HigA